MKRVCIFLFLILATAPLAHAQVHAITVQPSLLQLDLSTASPEASIHYTNSASIPVELSLKAQDYKPLEDGYQLSFSQKDVNNYHYGLSSWIHFSTNDLILNPKETQTLTIFIDKQKLSPGGHYATILASINPQATYSEQVQVKGILASLLFVRTNSGQEHENARIASFDVQRNFFDFPDTSYFRFTNMGDIDLTPYGLVQIFSTTNQLVAKGIVNETSAPTLPESIRRYYVSIHTLNSFLLPGFYAAHLSIHYGKSNKQLFARVPFFTFGSTPTLLFIFLIVAGLAGIVWWRKTSHS